MAQVSKSKTAPNQSTLHPELVRSDDQKNCTVVVMARALGYLGIGTSLVVVWLFWLLPSLQPIVPPSKPAKPDPHRRRSLPAKITVEPSQSIMRRTSLPPPPLSSCLVSKGHPNNDRHVSFSLSKPNRLPSPEEVLVEENPLTYFSEKLSGTSSPLSFSADSIDRVSSGSPESTPAPSEIHSESSSVSSQSIRDCPTKKLPNFKRVFSGKRTGNLNVPEFETESSPVRTPPKISGFSPRWPTSRPRSSEGRAASVDSSPTRPKQPFIRRFSRPSTPSTTSSPLPVLPCPRGKPERRQSTPVSPPRTQPYGAPYFAAPPVSFDVYLASSLETGRPAKATQSNQDINAPVPFTSTILDLNRGRRPTNQQQQAALGLGRTPVGKKRSASTGMVTTRNQV